MRRTAAAPTLVATSPAIGPKSIMWTSGPPAAGPMPTSSPSPAHPTTSWSKKVGGQANSPTVAPNGSRRPTWTAARAPTIITTRNASSTTMTTKPLDAPLTPGLLLEPPREPAQRQVGAGDQAGARGDDRLDRAEGRHPGDRHSEIGRA